MKKISLSLILIALFSCKEKKIVESVFDNKHYNLSHVYIDRGKFNSSYYILTDKVTQKKKEVENTEYSIFVDSLYLYYYHFGLSGKGFFVDLVNTQSENKLEEDTITNLTNYKFRYLEEDHIYIAIQDSLFSFCPITTMNSFDDFPSGKYYIPYPGILYKSKIKLMDFFAE